jgi:predicted O-methyltransferase YrrM
MPDLAQLAIQASPRIHALLARLHAASATQEHSFSQIAFYLTRIAKHLLFGSVWTPADDAHMRDKFVALEPDKCQFMYLLARSIGARHIVEAGTSFGVSTVYLALAVGQNVADARLAAGSGAAAPVSGKVVATEKEPSKAEKARAHWAEAGEEVEPWIDLRVGDLLETLQVEEGMPGEIDMVLLDSKSIPDARGTTSMPGGLREWSDSDQMHQSGRHLLCRRCRF